MVKKLVLVPERYDGRWAIGSAQVSGYVDLRGDQRPAGLLFESPGSLPESGAMGFPLAAAGPEVLRGRLRTNHEVVLTGTRLIHAFPGRTRLQADTALVGGEVPDELLFSSVEFQVGGLTELATVRPLGEIQFPETLRPGVEVSAKWGDNSIQRWTTAEGDLMELEFIATISHKGWYGLGLRTSPVVRVKGERRSVEEWMSRYVLPLAEIATFATQRRQPVSWVQVRPTQDQWPVQVFTVDIETQAIYEATEPDFREMLSEQHSSLIPLGPDGVDLAEVIAQWHTIRDEHHTFHEYLTLQHREPSMSPRARFLAAVPALEALHDALHGPPPPGRNEEVRTEVLDRVRQLPGLTPEDLEYLDKRLAPPEGHKLAHRLNTLVNDDLGADLRAIIAEHTDPLPTSLALEGTDGRQTIWETMATARNRIAHGKTPVPSAEQITALMRSAHTLATALALGRLGVTDTALRAGISQGRWSML